MNLSNVGRRMGSFAAAAAITLTCGLWTHDASADNRVGEFVTNAADWTYAPVITRLPNGSGADVITVDNVLAVAKPGIANGENLIAVWYVRESPGGTTWAAKTWEDTTWAGIAQRLKDDLGLTDEELAIFGQGPTGSAAASAPLNYIGGFVAGDPMEPIVNDTDPQTRELMVEILKTTGYKIADPVFDEKHECGRDAKLNAYAQRANSVTSATTAQSAASAMTTMIACEVTTTKGPTEVWLPDGVPVPGSDGPATWEFVRCEFVVGQGNCSIWSKQYRVRATRIKFHNGTLCIQQCDVSYVDQFRCCSYSPCPDNPASNPPCLDSNYVSDVPVRPGVRYLEFAPTNCNPPCN